MGDRLRGEQAQLLHHFIEVGEYGLALKEIAGALAQDKIAVTDQERGDMLAASARDASSETAVTSSCPTQAVNTICV